jgi:hypothetical protein
MPAKAGTQLIAAKRVGIRFLVLLDWLRLRAFVSLW